MLKNRFVMIGAAAGALAIAGGAAYLTGALAGGSDKPVEQAQQEGPPPSPVEIAKAVTAELAPLSEAPGSVVSLRDSLIAAATAGKIVWVADVGAEIEEGGVVARIDPSDAAFARDAAVAEVKRLEARVAYLDRQYERWADLGDEFGESETSLDQMRADRDDARQSLASARVALQRAETNLERTEVRAPFPGRVVTQQAQIGEFANPGTAIARLVDIRHLEVTAQAPASLLASIKPGDEVTVKNGEMTLKAPVRAVVPVGDQVSRLLELRLSLPEPVWHIGSAVRVSLPMRAPQRVVAADRDALVLRANRVSVFVVGDDMKARQVDVELGAADGDLIELIGAVNEGDRLVIRGGERLRDGQTVSIQDPANGAQASATANIY
ncbi:MAG: efflux RND transporter periplasmic adaptor subunit [Pseudomonadota bacterium]|nr:efflux RND transporter periplasmic adaptor subunit [Pseudomonadota bacterium]